MKLKSNHGPWGLPKTTSAQLSGTFLEIEREALTCTASARRMPDSSATTKHGTSDVEEEADASCGAQSKYRKRVWTKTVRETGAVRLHLH